MEKEDVFFLGLSHICNRVYALLSVIIADFITAVFFLFLCIA